MSTNLKPLQELSIEQLTFLKQQLGSNSSKTELQIVRDQARLDSKLDKRDENHEKVIHLSEELTRKQSVLQALQNAANIAPDILQSQVDEVEKIRKELTRAQIGPNTLTDVEAYLEQYEINMMGDHKVYYEARYVEVDAVLAAKLAS